jgi:hypothetical protein
MTLENGPIPDWALQERQYDMEWIKENLYIFWPVATEAYVGLGRGAIIVDTTSRPTGEGHPFGYFPQSFIEQYEYDDIKRMVRDYDPDNELVVVVLKPEDHISTYRVQPYPRPR